MNTSLSYPVKHSLNVPIEQFYVYGVNNTQADTHDTEYIIRDKNIPNRYWLKFPPTWRTSEQKERVIGIRSLWMNRAYQRFIGIWIDYKSGEETNSIGFNLRYDEDLVDRLNEEMSKVDSRIHFVVSTHDKQFDVIVYSYSIEFQLTLYNYETVNVFNSFDEKGEPVSQTPMSNSYRFTNVWNRHFVMFTSSIASNNSKNEIGFSEVRYNPVKYFKVNSNESEFWVDLWMGSSILIPVVLPRDEKDGFNMEVIFLHDNSDELYT